MKEKVYLVVYQERMLGYVYESQQNLFFPLSAPITKGNIGSYDIRIISNVFDIRLATIQDGIEYRVDLTQYDNDSMYDYVYEK